jgi:hypothetical protein
MPVLQTLRAPIGAHPAGGTLAYVVQALHGRDPSYGSWLFLTAVCCFLVIMVVSGCNTYQF